MFYCFQLCSEGMECPGASSAAHGGIYALFSPLWQSPNQQAYGWAFPCVHLLSLNPPLLKRVSSPLHKTLYGELTQVPPDPRPADRNLRFKAPVYPRQV